MRPSVEAYTALIRGFTAGEGLSKGLRLLQQMIDDGVEPNKVTATTVLTAAVDAGNVGEARRLATQLRERAHAADNFELADAVDAALVVALCRPAAAVTMATTSAAAVPQGKAAKAVSAAAARAGLDVGVGGYGFPQGPRNRARVAEAARLHGAMVARGAPPDVRTCNALLAGLTEAQMPSLDAAERLLGQMERGDAAPPNAHTLSMLMGAYGERRQLSRSKMMWGVLQASAPSPTQAPSQAPPRAARRSALATPPLTPRRSPRVAAQERGWADVVALNGWLQAAIRCGRLQLALQAFQEAKAADPPLRLDVVTFGTLIHGLEAQGTRPAAERAIRLWAEMRALRVAPDDGVVAAIMRAATRHLNVRAALVIRQDLLKTGWSAARLRRHDALIAPCCRPSPRSSRTKPSGRRSASASARSAASSAPSPTRAPCRRWPRRPRRPTAAAAARRRRMRRIRSRRSRRRRRRRRRSSSGRGGTRWTGAGATRSTSTEVCRVSVKRYVASRAASTAFALTATKIPWASV